MGVDFDDVVFLGEGVQSILNIIFINDIEVMDDVDGGGLQYVVVFIRQSLGGSDDDGVISVNIQRVEVFYVIDCDVVVLSIMNNFVFDFFLIFYIVFNEYLRIGSEGFVVKIYEFVFVVGEIVVQIIKSVSSVDNDGEVNIFDDVYGFVDVVGGSGFCVFFVD